MHINFNKNDIEKNYFNSFSLPNTYAKDVFLKKFRLLIILLDIFCLLLIMLNNKPQYLATSSIKKPSKQTTQIISPKATSNPPQQFTAYALEPENPDQQVIERILLGIPDHAKEAAKRNLPYIIDALRQENILNDNVLAYAVATIEHETAETFEPIPEYNGPYHAWIYGYDGGTQYYGRGFIQLTHLKNYQDFGERIGLGDTLVTNPDVALQPDIAAKILAAFFKDNGIAKLATDGNFVAARTPINPDWNGRWIATLTTKYL